MNFYFVIKINSLHKNSTLKLDTNTFDDGFTALILAVRANKPNAVRYLCRIGADISLRCHLGTALEIAKENCNGEKIKLTKWLEISDEERQSLLENHSSESNV